MRPLGTNSSKKSFPDISLSNLQTRLHACGYRKHLVERTLSKVRQQIVGITKKKQTHEEINNNNNNNNNDDDDDDDDDNNAALY